MLRRCFIPALRRKRGFDLDTVVFQQDGAPPHCLDRTLQYLCQYLLGDHLILRRTDNPWPPYSPDLPPLDYFLWGYLKERVCEDNPDTIERLKKNKKKEKSGEFQMTFWRGSWTISMSEWRMSSSSEAPGLNT